MLLSKLLARTNRSSETMKKYDKEIITCDPTKYAIDLISVNENAIDLQRVKGLMKKSVT